MVQIGYCQGAPSMPKVSALEGPGENSGSRSPASRYWLLMQLAMAAAGWAAIGLGVVLAV